jgi:inhibitor of KinA sporulation pathway (predicted exonuclease)
MSDSLLSFTSVLYIDLELTCWDTAPSPGLRQEIIEIGVVEMDLDRLEITREAKHYVRPAGLWEISDYCTKITGITREDVLGAQPLEKVLNNLSDVFNPTTKWTVAWGQDVTVLQRACNLAGINTPFRRQLDLCRLFRELFLVDDQPSLKAAVDSLGMAFEGVPHGALPDARNTARIHADILQKLRRISRQAEPTAADANSVSSLSPFGEKVSLIKLELGL